MSSWQIPSLAPNTCHWEAMQDASNVSPLPPPIPLPSMLDLLLQGDPFIAGEARSVEDSFSFSKSLFKTGSGKRVTISPNGIIRAKTLLDSVDNDSSIQSPKGGKNLHQEQHNVIDSPSIGGGHLLKNGVEELVGQKDAYHAAIKQTPIKFHTAGGRSISISNDALQRARSLLGDPDVGDFFEGGGFGDLNFSFPSKRGSSAASALCSNERSACDTPLGRQVTPESNYVTKGFTYPLQPSRQKHLSSKFLDGGNGNNLIAKFDAVGDEKPLCGRSQPSDSAVSRSSLNGFSSKVDSCSVSLRRSLVDVSNVIKNVQSNNRQHPSGKRRLGLCVTVSPFKKPRSSKNSVPSDKFGENSADDLSQFPSVASGSERKVSTRYPFQYPRIYIKEFFAVPPLEKTVHFPNLNSQVTSVNAEKYVFHEGSGDNGMGAEAFVHLLVHHGASIQFATKEWVMNHYKWIVWKLACYERYYSVWSAGKFLTVSNVLEELKYRYEREVNHGHRSTIKKILEGDALPSSMMILCISNIHSNDVPENGTFMETQTVAQKTKAVTVELTDGWYSINAILDVPLSKQQAAGRLFVGQKLRIWGAGLSCWNGPVSPLEVSSTVSLLLHLNGTYRAHWAERLGFCKVPGPPLAFRCIKSNGGLIPQTLAGITRIYPILYRERLSSGQCVVMSERMENKMTELYNQRRSAVVDGIISEYQKESSRIYDDIDSEGAKIYNLLETAEEPEFLMADMSREQLNSFAAYKAKLNAIRQSEMEKSVEKALKDAGLGHREVTPFMRLRVVGLTYKTRQDKIKEGIVTIWNPTEKQCQELVEGGAYAIAGLTSSGSDFDILHLQARGPSTKWLPLSSNAREQFKPFFRSRESIPLSSLGDIPLSSEFDIAAYVVHVGEVYTSSQQKKQWVFVTDGSIMNGLQSEKLLNSLLAICFCSPLIDYDSFPPINYNLEGSMVGFCNLIKKEKDHTNHIWVADSSQNSTYYLNFDSPHCSHLKNSATSVRRWANNSSLIIGKLKQKALNVVGEDCKA